ncbi:class I SAM-dependent methyltransferase [Streptomyces sp. R44]|uniref:Class I SAM-dependent methyltransferase n=1 Tax=Streptomyces sp. R44 TaxID=3238633 RepID=A0AB39T7M3_9ACTN
MSVAEFDEIAPKYDESRGGTERAAGFARMLAPLLDPARPVLDIGVGTGIVAAELTSLGHTVHGLDLSPGMLARAKDRLGARVAVADACRLPVQSGSVDQAVSTWLLHAGPDNRAVLAEVGRVLRPGGRYLVIPAGGTRPTDDIGLLVGELENRLDPEGSRRDGPEWLAPIAAAHGLVYEGTASERPTSFQVSPRAMAASLSRGLFTGAWAVGGEATRLVDETRSRLLALPNPDVPRVRRGADVVLLFTRGT